MISQETLRQAQYRNDLVEDSFDRFASLLYERWILSFIIGLIGVLIFFISGALLLLKLGDPSHYYGAFGFGGSILSLFVMLVFLFPPAQRLYDHMKV